MCRPGPAAAAPAPRPAAGTAARPRRPAGGGGRQPAGDGDLAAAAPKRGAGGGAGVPVSPAGGPAAAAAGCAPGHAVHGRQVSSPPRCPTNRTCSISSSSHSCSSAWQQRARASARPAAACGMPAGGARGPGQQALAAAPGPGQHPCCTAGTAAEWPSSADPAPGGGSAGGTGPARLHGGSGPAPSAPRCPAGQAPACARPKQHRLRHAPPHPYRSAAPEQCPAAAAGRARTGGGWGSDRMHQLAAARQAQAGVERQDGGARAATGKQGQAPPAK